MKFFSGNLNYKKRTLRVLLTYFMGCTYGAYFSTIATVDTTFFVNHIDVFPFADDLYGTFRGTCTTSNTIFTNSISQIIASFKILFRINQLAKFYAIPPGEEIEGLSDLITGFNNCFFNLFQADDMSIKINRDRAIV